MAVHTSRPSKSSVSYTHLDVYKRQEAAALENYAIKYKIKGSMWKKPFRRGKSEYGEEGLTQINQLRRRAVEPVLPLEKLIKAAAHAGQDAAGTKAEGTACLLYTSRCV